jgi:hypothetical protein
MAAVGLVEPAFHLVKTKSRDVQFVFLAEAVQLLVQGSRLFIA